MKRTLGGEKGRRWASFMRRRAAVAEELRHPYSIKYPHSRLSTVESTVQKEKCGGKGLGGIRGGGRSKGGKKTFQ